VSYQTSCSSKQYRGNQFFWFVVVSCITLLQIRDFDWITDENTNVYTALLRGLSTEWLRDIASPVTRAESLCLAVWSRIILMTEFDFNYLQRLDCIHEDFGEKCKMSSSDFCLF
jgi:hypothetical protein